MSKEIYEFEICRNAEGDILATAGVKGDGSSYRIAGPKAWGGSKRIAVIEISQSDMVEFIRCYAPGALAALAAPAVANGAQARSQFGSPELQDMIVQHATAATMLPALPMAYGVIDVYHDDGRVASVDGWTADQVRGYAIDYGIKLGCAAIAASSPKAALTLEWHPLKSAGQAKKGDYVRFDLCDEKKVHQVALVLHPGTDEEEIIYHRRNNWYLITSMSIAGMGSQKNVEILLVNDALTAAGVAP